MGAMVYLRLGWLVGNSGLIGALFILGCAYIITGTTALSLSSIATNLHVKAGGAFAIISQALGIEAGGAIGIPLYIAQTLSSVLYIFAFTEAWAIKYPLHHPMVVALCAFTVVAAIAWSSAHLAFRAQAVMLIVVSVALLSALGGWYIRPPTTPELFGTFEHADLSTTFAIFFPAATGIMVGVGMSGELKDPRISIPKGTLAAWGVSLLVYSIFAVWYATMGTSEELVRNKTIMFERSVVPDLILIGLFSSTLMAALSTLVSAPRLLYAMAQHHVVIGSKYIANRTDKNNLRNATIITFSIAALGLLSGSLDAIAPVITSFFIVTYLALNGVVLLEQRLAMISFRPTFKVSSLVPAVGVISASIALIATSVGGGLLELLLIIAIYTGLMRRKLQTPWETLQSGLLIRAANWIADRVSLIERPERAWKPDILMPVFSAEGAAPLISLINRFGNTSSVRLVGVDGSLTLARGLARQVEQLREEGHSASSTVLNMHSPIQDTTQFVLEAMRGTLFPPNIVAIIDDGKTDQSAMFAIADQCRRMKLGFMIFIPPTKQSFTIHSDDVAIWLSYRGPDWSLQLHAANLDLPVLIAHLLTRDNNGIVHLNTAVHQSEARGAQRFLEEVKTATRLEKETTTSCHTGDFLRAIRSHRQTPLHVFGLPAKLDVHRLRIIAQQTGGAGVLFLMDSGHESALA
jgi:amino acid transporter